MYRSVWPLLLAVMLPLSGCAAGQENTPRKTEQKEMNEQPSPISGEARTHMDNTENVIYLAGGCFWGMEQLMQSIPGVLDAESGYANGTCEADADYQTVCRGNTGFRETVRVEYDPKQVSLDALLLAYFYVIDPTVENRQGNDIGSQYQTGVYYTNDSKRETVERIAEIERGRSDTFAVEIGPLINYYTAEEYHQNYLEKNPGGYCHIPSAEMELFSRLRIDPGDYKTRCGDDPRQADARTVSCHPGERNRAPFRTHSGISSKRGSTWTSSPVNRSSPPLTNLKAAVAGLPLPSPSKRLRSWNWKIRVTECDARKSEAELATPTSVMCLPTTLNPPMACDTASTVRRSASCLTQRWRTRAMDISCTCLKTEPVIIR